MTVEAIDAEFQTALAIVPAAPLAAWTPRFVLPIEEMVQASNDMTEFQRRIMEKDVHYGVIPGTDKPTLLKPGAELLLSRMALHAADPTILSETIDYGDCDSDGAVTREGLIRFSLQVNIYHQTGATENERVLVGSGIGACTSREKKYRWRDGSPTCPDCGKGLRMSKNKPEWYCWAKMGGCSATFPKSAFEQVGRVFNPDLADQENTIFKMAKKRALIDATLVATGCSNVFTQDVGDNADSDDLAEQYARNYRPASNATDRPGTATLPGNGANSGSRGTSGTQAVSPGLSPAAGRAPTPAPIHATKAQTQELLDLSKSLGIEPLGEWIATHVAADFPDRSPRLLTRDEAAKAKALLEALIPDATEIQGEYQEGGVSVTAPRMDVRTNGRLFAMLSERGMNEKQQRIDWAYSEGVTVLSFSQLSEEQGRALIRKLELIPPLAPQPDPDDALDEYEETR